MAAVLLPVVRALRDRIEPSGIQRMTSGQPAYAQVCSFDQSMLPQSLDAIVRTRWLEAADITEHRRDAGFVRLLEKLKHSDYKPAHQRHSYPSNPARSKAARDSARTSSNVAFDTSFRATTTISKFPVRRYRLSLKTSRISRLMRFRFTAEGSSFFVTAIPIRCPESEGAYTKRK